MKLSSGREVEVKEWTQRQRVKIDDAMTEYYYRLGVDLTDSEQVSSAPFSFGIALDGIEYAVKNVPADLDNVEIIELFNKIYEASHISELDKKK